ncbi:5-amino-6-(D-ribitylamino)uracil--L-tyrosine 4-hydroxyphenyl transferase CofH [Martelella sp. HB161492]|uniref:5-amino-6-(D-ribitylamino)uracil--L-tyrosine 4-hydroxyphenyl transferase CofH n=1 Tax=Martelella sp. HB161492 TaxID=2720726 RepID=UPI0015920BC8
MITAVVPLKSFSKAKSRLADVLPPDLRAQLARAMAGDVLAVLAEIAEIDAVLVVTEDPSVARLARAAGADVLLEPSLNGYNSAARAAADFIGADKTMLLVPGDLPALAAGDIRRLIATHGAGPGLTLVPDRIRDGTNALMVTPADGLTFCFGPASFERHQEAAREAGLAVQGLELETIGFDLDHPEDLAALCVLPLGPLSRSAFAALKTAEPTINNKNIRRPLGLETDATSRRETIMTTTLEDIVSKAAGGIRISDDEALALLDLDATDALTDASRTLRDEGHGDIITFSRKVFIPLTHLCRDVCHYCTFAHPPKKGESAFMTPAEVLAVAEAGKRAGCKEALFTLGDKPELRYRAAREQLAELGYADTVSYIEAMAAMVLKETGLLPHVNGGVMTAGEIARLRKVSVSQGIMLETVSTRLSERGGPHFGSPDKLPAPRLQMMREAGAAAIPFTSGILIGIGETRQERIESLLALRDIHENHGGHIQEIIIQNFRAKADTKMANAPEPDLDEQVWTIAMARLIFGARMNIQSPPNLRPEELAALINAGINDWGGISPVTPDHVNPEAPWPQIVALERETEKAGKILAERLAAYPPYARDAAHWVDAGLHGALLRHQDSEGYARPDNWIAGSGTQPPTLFAKPPAMRANDTLHAIVDRAFAGKRLSEDEIVRLFAARGGEYEFVRAKADELRHAVCGDDVSYVVTRNINYTNICYFKCQFCAFSKGKMSENLRGRPYNLPLEEIRRRVVEAWHRGGTEVCLQGGIHPEYTGQTYLDICETIRKAEPAMHIHAFSPLEVWQGAETLGLSVPDFLVALKEAGLSSMPGTAAEILDDEVRRDLCPDKINTAQWMEVVEAAHRAGIRTTATIMFGHIDRPEHWARHILRVRDIQERTGGFTEFVGLPFVPMETPIYLKNRSRLGPTYREAMLMHAIARLALNPVLTNIQASWVKLGAEGLSDCLTAGANDAGGTLMEETITRAAGAVHGQEMAPHEFVEMIRALGRTPRLRNTLYETAPESRMQRAFQAPPLEPSINTLASKYDR